MNVKWVKKYESKNKSNENSEFTCYAKHDTSEGQPTVSPSPSEITIYVHRWNGFQNTRIIFPNVE